MFSNRSPGRPIREMICANPWRQIWRPAVPNFCAHGCLRHEFLRVSKSKHHHQLITSLDQSRISSQTFGRKKMEAPSLLPWSPHLPPQQQWPQQADHAAGGDATGDWTCQLCGASKKAVKKVCRNCAARKCFAAAGATGGSARITQQADIATPAHQGHASGRGVSIKKEPGLDMDSPMGQEFFGRAELG